jgi:hypothetical protein
MKMPSVDRIDPMGHYEKSNVRWVEMEENRRLRWFNEPIRKAQFEKLATEFFAGAKEYGWRDGLTKTALIAMVAKIRGKVSKSGTGAVLVGGGSE